MELLNDTERRMLVEIIDLHLEGMDDAKECMISDTVTLSDLDTFTITLQDHDIDVLTVKRIREKLVNDRA